MKKNKKNFSKKGFIAFTSLLVISAVTLAIAMSVSLIGINSATSSLGYQKSQGAVKIGESCLEETLLRLRNDGNFSGVSLSLGEGSCIATVSASGNTRTIWITSTIAGPPQYSKMLNAAATRVGKSITITSWTETSSLTPTPTTSPTVTPTNTVTPTPTNSPTPTPTPANCNEHCQQTYTLPGSCKKSNICGGHNDGAMYECSPPNICCCE